MNMRRMCQYLQVDRLNSSSCNTLRAGSTFKKEVVSYAIDLTFQRCVPSGILWLQFI
jgi:hypothetical protein